MARPKQTIPSISKHVSLPKDLCDRIEADLYSPLEGKIPQGAQQAFFTTIVREHFARMDQLRAESDGVLTQLKEA